MKSLAQWGRLVSDLLATLLGQSRFRPHEPLQIAQNRGQIFTISPSRQRENEAISDLMLPSQAMGAFAGFLSPLRSAPSTLSLADSKRPRF